MNSTVNILLVDDEPRNLEVLEGVLQHPEYRLVRAVTAQEALLALLHEDFAAIVLDIQMPVVSGLELAQLIKQREKTQRIPIIFLTALYQDEQRMLDSYNVGAVDYLTKPVNPQVLRSKIGVFVDLFRKTAELQQTNAALNREIVQRQNAEAALQSANEELETRVEARTAALREARDAAERAGRAKDEFLATLSHELRTPLTPVLMTASALRDDRRLPDDARSQLDMIERNIALEARLIDDLLDVTTIANGKLRLRPQPSDLHELIELAVEIVRDEAQAKQIVIERRLAAGLSEREVDPARFQQVIWNLLRNAVKFTPPGGRIVLTTENHSDPGGAPWLRITVTDSGVGIDPSELEAVFRPFEQGGRTGDHRFGGLGLGLAIVRAILRLHGGSIFARSAGPNTGATFTIDLPGAGKATAPAPVRGREGLPPSTATAPPGQLLSLGISARLLLVEDHEATLQVISRLLTEIGLQVVTARNLTEALDQAARGKFDLVVSDVGLPDGTGPELMEKLRDRYGLRGIALSGYGMEEDLARSRQAGFVAHLIKPVDFSQLRRVLTEVLGESQRLPSRTIPA